ncbi:hypothetical protein CDCA_CDCA11G3149 [Cyanidium caldarium]|uniref:Ribosomal protein S18 n=1 Tax=Cyanidium caldarium TaxID=2771 RepID=A0AAV9IYE4_CYACA|nr:hypothetical protein CDCA_CDCA11G3149 [Cyanidium caldarium]
MTFRAVSSAVPLWLARIGRRCLPCVHNARLDPSFRLSSAHATLSRHASGTSGSGRGGKDGEGDKPPLPPPPDRTPRPPSDHPADVTDATIATAEEEAMVFRNPFVPRRDILKKERILEYMADSRIDLEHVALIPADELQRMASVYTMLKRSPAELWRDSLLPLQQFLKVRPDAEVQVPREVMEWFRREVPPGRARTLETLDSSALWDPTAESAPRPRDTLPRYLYNPDVGNDWRLVDQRTTGPDELRRSSTGGAPSRQRDRTQNLVSLLPLSSMAPQRRQLVCPICVLAGDEPRRRALKWARRQRRLSGQKLAAGQLQLQEEALPQSSDPVAAATAAPADVDGDAKPPRPPEGDAPAPNIPHASPAMDHWLQQVQEAAFEEARAVSARSLLDYRNVALLMRFIGESGRILPRRRTKCCARHQRQLARAIKLARNAALISPVSRMGTNLVGHLTPL